MPLSYHGRIANDLVQWDEVLPRRSSPVVLTLDSMSESDRDAYKDGDSVSKWGEFAVPDGAGTPVYKMASIGGPAFDVNGVTDGIMVSTVYETDLIGDVVFLVFTVSASPASVKVILGQGLPMDAANTKKHTLVTIDTSKKVDLTVSMNGSNDSRGYNLIPTGALSDNDRVLVAFSVNRVNGWVWSQYHVMNGAANPTDITKTSVPSSASNAMGQAIAPLADVPVIVWPETSVVYGADDTEDPRAVALGNLGGATGTSFAEGLYHELLVTRIADAFKESWWKSNYDALVQKWLS